MELNQPGMDEPEETRQLRSIRIGPDQVTISGQEVVIEAKHEMPDWQLREASPDSLIGLVRRLKRQAEDRADEAFSQGHREGYREGYEDARDESRAKAAKISPALAQTALA